MTHVIGLFLRNCIADGTKVPAMGFHVDGLKALAPEAAPLKKH